MTKDQHFVALQNMCLAAPISELYHPSIEISDSEATIEIEVSEQFFHAAGALHSSVYFKMLDDAAFFAANSLERDVFVPTTSFTTYLTRPVSSGTLRSLGVWSIATTPSSSPKPFCTIQRETRSDGGAASSCEASFR